MYLKKVFWQEKEFLPEKFLLLYRLTILVKNRKTIALARVYKPKHLTKDYYAYYFLSDGFLVHRKEHDAGTAVVLIPVTILLFGRSATSKDSLRSTTILTYVEEYPTNTNLENGSLKKHWIWLQQPDSARPPSLYSRLT